MTVIVSVSAVLLRVAQRVAIVGGEDVIIMVRNVVGTEDVLFREAVQRPES